MQYPNTLWVTWKPTHMTLFSMGKMHLGSKSLICKMLNLRNTAHL